MPLAAQETVVRLEDLERIADSETMVMVPMRDGVRLATDVYLPKGDGPFPVLYLLHGAWGSFRDWPDHADQQLRELAAEYGVVIVCPDGAEFGRGNADAAFDLINDDSTLLRSALLLGSGVRPGDSFTPAQYRPLNQFPGIRTRESF